MPDRRASLRKEDRPQEKPRVGRRWVLVFAAAALVIGFVLGFYVRSPENSSVYLELAEEHDTLGTEMSDAQERETSYEETVSGLRDEVEQLETPFRELDEREEGLDERDGELQTWDEELGERSTELDTRSEELDEREEGIDTREGELDEAETQAELETIPGEGTFLVNEEVLPGTYRSEDVGSCYWARLSSADGTLDSIIANEFGGGQQVVTIAASDYAFETNGCGSWNKV